MRKSNWAICPKLSTPTPRSAMPLIYPADDGSPRPVHRPSPPSGYFRARSLPRPMRRTRLRILDSRTRRIQTTMIRSNPSMSKRYTVRLATFQYHLGMSGAAICTSYNDGPCHRQIVRPLGHATAFGSTSSMSNPLWAIRFSPRASVLDRVRSSTVWTVLLSI